MIFTLLMGLVCVGFLFLGFLMGAVYERRNQVDRVIKRHAYQQMRAAYQRGRFRSLPPLSFKQGTPEPQFDGRDVGYDN